MSKKTSDTISTQEIDIIERCVEFAVDNSENITIIDVERARAVVHSLKWDIKER